MVSHQCVFSCNNWGDFSLRKFDHNFCIGFFSVYIMLQLRFFSLRIFFHIACIDMVSHPCSHIIIEDIFFCKKELSHWHHWYGFPKCVSSFGNWGIFYLRKVYHIPCIEMASPSVCSCVKTEGLLSMKKGSLHWLHRYGSVQAEYVSSNGNLSYFSLGTLFVNAFIPVCALIWQLRQFFCEKSLLQ